MLLFMYRGDFTGGRPAGRKVAIIGCEAKAQFCMKFRGKRRPNREFVALAVKSLGLEPLMHTPVENIDDFPKTGGFGGIIMGGSSLYVRNQDIAENDWLKKLIDFVRELHGKVPILGLCFGHQVIGRAFGSQAKIYGPGIFYEAGFVPVMLTPEGKRDVLFRGMPERFSALFSHYSCIPWVPEVGIALALPVNQANPSIQAMRVGESTWGVQFHPEYPESGIKEIVLKDRAAIEEHVDVEAVLRSLKPGKREDVRTLENFADFVLST
ncbi:hypothetical protein GF318_04700 [Candidatus Micrarchaeota archaeon]|nr:hypothetical protein [Candidatus Micrarchaeota archaeon]